MRTRSTLDNVLGVHSSSWAELVDDRLGQELYAINDLEDGGPLVEVAVHASHNETGRVYVREMYGGRNGRMKWN